MAKILAMDVHVTDPKTWEVTVLKAGDPLPKKFEKLVTNEAALVPEDVATEAVVTDAEKKAAEEAEMASLLEELTKRELPTEGSIDEMRARIGEDDAEKAEAAKQNQGA